MSMLAQCKHCRAKLDATGKAPGDSMVCQCGALVFVTDVNAAAPSALTSPKVQAEQTGSPHPNADLLCPRCGVKLLERRSQTMRAHDCPACEGIWLSSESFASICKKKQEESTASGVNAGPNAVAKARLSAAEDVKYIACPCCKDRMNRQNFAKVSGVIIDICPKHGVWLDRHELSIIVHFIETGGMKRAQAVGGSMPALSPKKLASNSRPFADPTVIKAKEKSVAWEAAATVLDVVLVVADIFGD